jgi:glutathione synthase/RimK-type ligase-like ATP-grasp enzyme
MKLRVVPYRPGSYSARLLAEKLSEKVGQKVWRGRPKFGHDNLLWGKPGHPATDKRATFKILEEAGVSCVPNTTSKEEATKWLQANKTVFARSAGGQGGSGIVVVQPPAEELPDAELYTQYVKKKKEFRVHVVNNNVVAVQEKRKKSGVDANPLVRSHTNGWVFCFKNIVEPNGLRVLGLNAVRAVGLDFGAVDIIYNALQDKCYVLEVNTAPGLCNTTATVYADAIYDSFNS